MCVCDRPYFIPIGIIIKETTMYVCISENRSFYKSLRSEIIINRVVFAKNVLYIFYYATLYYIYIYIVQCKLCICTHYIHIFNLINYSYSTLWVLLLLLNIYYLIFVTKKSVKTASGAENVSKRKVIYIFFYIITI